MTSKFEIVDGHKLRKKVRVVIANEHGRFLLIQPHGYGPDTWTLVGGGVEEGESDEQAILREIHEEIGISALIALHMSTARHWYQFSDRIKTQRKLDHDGQIAKVFFAVVTSGSDTMCINLYFI
jgi:8-oxo-dGTP pyrophosphatase MutT (NUDIX family)